MSRSTLIFGIVVLLLTAAVSFTIFEIWRRPKPAVKGAAAIAVGAKTESSPEASSSISAKSAVLWDSDAAIMLFQKNAFEVLPIASITKIMTAMVALDYEPDWNRAMTINPDEYGPGGQLMLGRGEVATMKDLFNASLMGSANNATLAYVRGLNLTQQDFVDAMNRKAIQLGLEQTHFIEPTGLDPGNVSTAFEVAKMAQYAFDRYPIIADVSARSEYTFKIGGSGREHTIRNPDKLISQAGYQFEGSKTGFLYEAGYCLVVRDQGDKRNRIAVVLGSPSEEQHFTDIARLLNLPSR